MSFLVGVVVGAVAVVLIAPIVLARLGQVLAGNERIDYKKSVTRGLWLTALVIIPRMKKNAAALCPQ